MDDDEQVIRGPWPRKRLSEAEIIAKQKVIDRWWEQHRWELAQKQRGDPTGEDDIGEWIWGPGYRQRGRNRR